MRPRLNFSPAQARAGRVLCDLTPGRLAELAGLESEAVELYESGEGELSPEEHEALCEALYADGWGVIAIQPDLAGEGVRFARPLAASPMLDHRASRQAPPVVVRERARGDW